MQKEKGTAESDPTPSEPMKKETPESVLKESSETAKQESLEPVSVPPRNIESAQEVPEAVATAAAVVNVPETESKETSAGEKKEEMLIAN